MLNCINGVYAPEVGFDHLPRPDLLHAVNSHQVAVMGGLYLSKIWRHQQAMDNIMSRPQPEDRATPLQARIGPPRRNHAPRGVEKNHRF
jgi:hypothetical protein